MVSAATCGGGVCSNLDRGRDKNKWLATVCTGDRIRTLGVRATLVPKLHVYVYDMYDNVTDARGNHRVSCSMASNYCAVGCVELTPLLLSPVPATRSILCLLNHNSRKGVIINCLRLEMSRDRVHLLHVKLAMWLGCNQI